LFTEVFDRSGTIQGTPEGLAVYSIRARDEGLTVAGNARNDYSVDLQTRRVAANQVASGAYSVIAGGERNLSSGTASYTHGYNNSATTTNATAFGFLNTASGTHSTSVGSQNTASGSASFATGNANTASGQYSSAIGGQQGTYPHYGQTGAANGNIMKTGLNATSPQWSRFILLANTATTTPFDLLFDGFNGTQRPTIAANRVWHVRGVLTATDLDNSSQITSWEFSMILQRDGANNTTAAGFASNVILDQNAGALTFTGAADNTNESLAITVTGITGTNGVNWSCLVDVFDSKRIA
jgi:hypothetical protein